MISLLVTYWPISLIVCGVVIWLCLRGLGEIGEQAGIAHEMHALIERDGRVQVELSARQIRYLRRWGFEVNPLERSGTLWWSEVTQ